MIKCQNKKVIPKGLGVKVPIDSNKARHIVKRTEQALLRERIKYIYEKAQDSYHQKYRRY